MAISARTQSEESTISNGQIGQLMDRLGTQLRSSGLSASATGIVLAMPGAPAIDEMLAVFRKHVEAHTGLITRRVSVDPTRSNRHVFAATGRPHRIREETIEAMPRGKGGEIEVVLFKGKQGQEPKDIRDEYRLRRLRPVDPITLAILNEADPAFSKEYPNITQWHDSFDYCFLLFCEGTAELVAVSRRTGNSTYDAWWWAGIRE